MAAHNDHKQTREIRSGRDYFENVFGDVYIQHAEALSAEEQASLRTTYLQRILKTASRLELTGIDRKATDYKAEACLNLGLIYTALLTLSTAQTMDSSFAGKPKEGVSSAEGNDQRLSAVEMLNRHPRFVLLGDPGSGKSTFVKFVVMCLAGEALGDDCTNLARLRSPLPDDQGENEEEQQPWDHGALLPVPVILRDFATKGLPPEGQQATAKHLWAFIARTLDELMLGEYSVLLCRHLRKQGGLLLLDGLDEVPEADRRRTQIKQAVEDFAASFPNCRILVTSRTYAYQQQDWRLSDFTEAVLAPFTQGQIRQFVDRWYHHIAELRGKDREDAQGRAEVLKRTIFSNARLHDFAKRPLLLTLMASLHAWRGGSLPEKRGELYAEAADLLLDWWERDKVVRNAEGQMLVAQTSLTEMLRVGKDRVQKVLNKLAFEAHASQSDLLGTADIPEEKLVMEFMRICRNENVNPVLLVKHLSDRAGLLIPHGVEVYTFPHRTFQEYLAACYLTGEQEYPDNVADLLRGDSERWREVVLLAAASVANAAPMIWLLADALCFREVEKQSTPGPSQADSGLTGKSTPGHPQGGNEDAWGALLAGQALIETADLEHVRPQNQQKLARIQSWLAAILTEQVPVTNPFPATERALAGNILAQLGDPRSGVGLREDGLPDIAWCEVPAGEFLMGSDQETVTSETLKWENLLKKINKENKIDDFRRVVTSEYPQHIVWLSTYWISRYPVTNTQYRIFIEDGGYTEKWRKYWTEEGWEWREKKNVTGPDWIGGKFDLPNHPVVGVSWYEAFAFCQWLTLQLRERGELTAKEEVRLPTEAEWEKAARGTDRRVYPWGNEQIHPELANYNEAGLGGTSSVGCFPRGTGPYGCEDLSGNVWDLCLDRYDESYYANSPKENPHGPASGSQHIGRGGAWSFTASHCRVAYRAYGELAGRTSRIGFRLVRTSTTAN